MSTSHVRSMSAGSRSALTLLALRVARARAAQRSATRRRPPASETSQKANAAADQAIYQPVEYTNAEQEGPGADRASPARSRATTRRSCRSSPPTTSPTSARSSCPAPTSRCSSARTSARCCNEFSSPTTWAIRTRRASSCGMGKLKSTKYVVKFDILKTEQVAAAAAGLRRPRARPDGGTAWRLQRLARRRAGRHGRRHGVGSVQTERGDRRLDHRHALQDHQRRDDRAGRARLHRGEDGGRRHVDRRCSAYPQSQQGGVSLDTMVQRLVQKSVWEIDNKYK